MAAQIENTFLAVPVRGVHLRILPIVSKVVGKEVLGSLDDVLCQSLVDRAPKISPKAGLHPITTDWKSVGACLGSQQSDSHARIRVTLTLIGKLIIHDACCVTTLPVAT
jgi:hypothetical protein